MSDSKLHSTLIDKTKSERKLLTEILHLLMEVEKRRLYSDFKCSSTFNYAVKILGYSEPQAGRRIQAMRLMRSVPEVEEKIKSKELTLTSAAQIQQFVNREERSEIAKNPDTSKSECRFTNDKKRDLIEKVSGLSSREAEQKLVAESKTPEIHREKIRALPNKRIELKFSIGASTQEKVEKLKGHLGHKLGALNLEDFFDQVCDLALEQVLNKKGLATPKKKKSPPKSNVAKKPTTAVKSKGPERCYSNTAYTTKSRRTEQSCADAEKSTVAKSQNTDETRIEKRTGDKSRKRSIPLSIRRLVWRRDNSKCVKCESTRLLEIEHRKPFSRGGENKMENLELNCRSCNQRAAVKEFGAIRMNEFLDRKDEVRR